MSKPYIMPYISFPDLPPSSSFHWKNEKLLLLLLHVVYVQNPSNIFSLALVEKRFANVTFSYFDQFLEAYS